MTKRESNRHVGIIGMGYVGLPLALAFTSVETKIIGFDVDQSKVSALNNGHSYLNHIKSDEIKGVVDKGLFSATDDFSKLRDVDDIVICVPTPLSKHREPDLSAVLTTGREIAKYLQPEQLVVLESSTYPGTTDEELCAVLEESGLKANKDFYLAYSPEREDPGNKSYSTMNIPKVVGADTPKGKKLAESLYSLIVPSVVGVSSSRVAEAVKLTENIFRSVNIALVNELKIIFEEMNIDIWEVIEAASSKPFGYMPFYPGPGLGGHCIPIDPFYLTFKAREFDVPTRFIELAGEINSSMPKRVVSTCARILSAESEKPVKNAKILIVGMAYKPNVDDMRESPALVLIDLFEERGAHVDYYDPFISEVPPTREYSQITGRKSIELTAEALSKFDLVLLSTNHDQVDYQLVADNVEIVVDTRNAFRDISGKAKIFKA
ncbi:MAG: UDP-N-acetyl-D-glucosamine dehydrogenase [Kiritimatiellaceae bacterium TMED266]|nr:MAG: UDP-N-acetyl-D-glucosamine dehydrogenase [Kiritimatiellaceae bacterium TMED266]